MTMPATPAMSATSATPATPAAQARCSAAELRELFLFEKLTDEQLDWLCREGRVVTTPPGMVYVEGDPAEGLYVLLHGTVVLSRLVGGDDDQVNTNSGPGGFAGAFFAYLRER